MLYAVRNSNFRSKCRNGLECKGLWQINLLNIADEQIFVCAKFSYNISQLKFIVSKMKHATQRYKQTMFEVLTIITTIEKRKKECIAFKMKYA